MFEQLFGSRTRVDLLKLFIENSNRSFFVRELTREIGAQINSVRRELENLMKIGVIFKLDEAPLREAKEWEDEEDVKKEAPKGLNKKKYYQLNPSFVLHDEFCALFSKSHLIAEKDFIKQLSNLANTYFLVMSGLFMGAEEASTDMLIVGNVKRQKLAQLIQTFEKRINKEINYTIMPLKEFQYRREITDKFIYDILVSPKIVVIDKLGVEESSDESEK